MEPDVARSENAMFFCCCGGGLRMMSIFGAKIVRAFLKVFCMPFFFQCVFVFPVSSFLEGDFWTFWEGFEG